MIRKFRLQGVNALGESVKLSADVVSYTDEKKYFSIKIESPNTIRLITPKGSYQMKKNSNQNIYQATLAGHKAQVSLQKVVGWIGYW
jgi:hypothetical protein